MTHIKNSQNILPTSFGRINQMTMKYLRKNFDFPDGKYNNEKIRIESIQKKSVNKVFKMQFSIWNVNVEIQKKKNIFTRFEMV